jgi:hypothetical protein
MTLYGIALFLHILGVINLFGGMVLVQQAGGRLRGSSTWEEARHWLGLLAVTRGMFAFGSVLLLVTGIYMTHQGWTYRPWIVVAIVVVVLFAVVGGAVLGRRLAGLGRMAAERSGPIADGDGALFRSPGFWSAVFALNGGALGVVWLMTNKPDWTVSIAVPVALTIFGALVGPSVAGGRAKRAA